MASQTPPAAQAGGVGREERPLPEKHAAGGPHLSQLRRWPPLMISANLELAGRVIVSLEDLQDSAEDQVSGLCGERPVDHFRIKTA